jgi:hypothetical protein
VRRLLGVLGFSVAALLASSCKETTTGVKESTFEVEISATSPFVDAGDYLVNDTVLFVGDVTEDGRPISASGQQFTSDNPGVVRILNQSSGQAAFVDTGSAVVTVSYSQPELQGPARLQAETMVQVTSYAVELSLTSTFTGGTVDPDAALVGDIVVVDATVRKDGAPVSSSVGTVTSSNNVVAEPVAGTSDQVEFKQSGTATLTVALAEPDIPGDTPLTATLDVTVNDLAVLIDVKSLVDSAFLTSGDTLVTDSVQFSATVIEDGDTVPTSGANWTSSNPSTIRIVDAASGVAVFEDTGTVTVAVTFTTPDLPGEPFGRNLRVTTYLAQIEQLAPGTTPIMGDTVQYGVTVTDTQDGSTVASPSVTYASSDPAVITILDAVTGLGLARDTGQAVVSVSVDDPRLPRGNATDALPPTVLTEELFYGAFSSTTGDFGNSASGDAIVMQRSPAHAFTDSTRVEFPNGTIGFVDAVSSDSLTFLVPAAADTGALLMRNLVDDQGDPRDNVPTRIIFDGPGSSAIDDFFEPNDDMPLTSNLEITSFPFEVLLSWDPTKSSPADSNFFWLFVPSGQTRRLDIVAEWQVDADIDFKVCNATGTPPTSYNPSLCPRPIGDNSNDPRVEDEFNLTLSTGIYVFNFYCESCPALPLTYKLTITRD